MREPEAGKNRFGVAQVGIRNAVRDASADGDEVVAERGARAQVPGAVAEVRGACGRVAAQRALRREPRMPLSLTCS